MTRLMLVMTSHNRRDLTLACLQALEAAVARAGGPDSPLALGGVLVDDDSDDGTADAVQTAHPWMQIEHGDGQLFWNRGMHRAIARALPQSADWLLWLNDDTLLHPDALQHLLKEHAALTTHHPGGVILVGATSAPNGALSYGGGRAVSRWRRFQYRPVWDAEQPQPCEVMNGNCVLMPMALARRLGNLDPVFEHAMGDTDYALRARRAGCAVFVASGRIGRCSNNPTAGTHEDARLSLRKRWAAIQHRKGLPWRSWYVFTRRHGGFVWPAYFLWPYLRLIVSSFVHRLPKD